jgi:hypothetical protein
MLLIYSGTGADDLVRATANNDGRRPRINGKGRRHFLIGLRRSWGVPVLSGVHGIAPPPVCGSAGCPRPGECQSALIEGDAALPSEVSLKCAEVLECTGVGCERGESGRRSYPRTVLTFGPLECSHECG